MFLALVMTLPQIGVAQNANDGYDPNANGTVTVLVVQPDGKTLVGGGFTNIAGQTRNRIARLNAEKSIGESIGHPQKAK
jgi:hypothetical protein